MILEPCRDEFDLPRDICYLNGAYMTPFPARFRAIGEAALAQRCRPWEVSSVDFFSRSERVRGLAASVMRTRPDKVAFVPAVSYGAAIAARNIRPRRGQIILTLAEEFPSNHYGWVRLADECGAEIVALPGPTDRDWSAAVLGAIAQHGERIALAALPHVHWSTGVALDLAAIAPALRRVGAALFLDLTQSLGAMEIDLDAIDPDFAVAAGYKWLFGPYSLGYLRVAERHLQGIPLEENWVNRAGSEDFTALVTYRDEYQPGARRFDVGERTSFQLMPLAEIALETVLGWGVGNIADTLRALNRRFVALLGEAGFVCPPEDRRSPHLLGARHRRLAASGIAAAWREAGILTSVRGNAIRIAPHLWIDEIDEHRFAEAVHASVSGI